MNKKFVPAAGSGSMNYAVFSPDDYTDLPLMVYLHGAGERGLNFDHVYRHGVPKMIAEGREYAAVVLVPQCPAQFVWDNVVRDLKKIIDAVAAEYRIKPDRICITGSSMGGFGSWMMALTYPALFSAAAPVAGGGMSWRAAKLTGLPIRAVHGTKDDVVPMIYSKLMCDAVVGCGGRAELVALEGFGHNDGIDAAYRSPETTDWLLAARRTDFNEPPEICSNLF